MSENITGSISGFRTVRTLNFHSRAKAIDVHETDKKVEEKLIRSGKQPSEPSDAISARLQAIPTTPPIRNLLSAVYCG